MSGTKNNEHSILQVPVAELACDVQQYINGYMMAAMYKVIVHSVRVEGKRGEEVLSIEVSKKD